MPLARNIFEYRVLGSSVIGNPPLGSNPSAGRRDALCFLAIFNPMSVTTIGNSLKLSASIANVLLPLNGGPAVMTSDNRTLNLTLSLLTLIQVLIAPRITPVEPATAPRMAMANVMPPDSMLRLYPSMTSNSRRAYPVRANWSVVFHLLQARKLGDPQEYPARLSWSSGHSMNLPKPSPQNIVR